MNDMSPIDDGKRPEPPRPSGWTGAGMLQRLPSGLGLVAAFTLTTFLSALLLFSIQPLFAKMVLPLLGGSPSVWAVALCFFQGALLAGYCYAHILMRRVAPEYGGFVHLGLFILALVALPIAVPSGWTEPPPGDPALWQIGLFTVAIGLPFVAVAANAPLLQAWFARTGHPDGRDPYFLYGASNLGSFAALLAYPLLLEPAFGLSSLSRQWTIGFVVLGLAIAICFWLMRQSQPVPVTVSVPSTLPGAAGGEPTDEAPPGWSQRLGWIGLAMVPSALLTAFTTHVATDVASAPLIWVIPLSLYLLTYVLVFRATPLALLPCAVAAAVAAWVFARWLGSQFDITLPTSTLLLLAIAAGGAFVYAYLKSGISPFRWLLMFHLGAVVIALVQLARTEHDTWMVSAAAGVAAFFFSALVAHRTLYEARPAARHLTEFYLLMSLGGVLGGLFAALIAPKLFSEVLEYPILLALTMACRPGALELPWRDRDEALRLWVIGAFGLLAVWWLNLSQIWRHVHEVGTFLEENLALLGVGHALHLLILWLAEHGFAVVLAVIFAALLLVWNAQPVRQMLAAALMCLAVVALPSSVRQGAAERSYFGVYRVSETAAGDYRVLMHGTTLHGAERIRTPGGDPVAEPLPATYYHPKSPMARTVDLVRARLTEDGAKGRFGVVGLGTGSLACFAKPGESWRFFEIDPVIVEIARDPERFNFISKCQPNLDVVLGDARLTIGKEPKGSYDLIIIDAFSSDAVPVHLLTAEAIRLYADRLTPKGVVLLHISNRYLDLDSVLSATLPLVPGLKGLILEDNEADGSYASTSSTVGIFSRSDEVLAPFRALDMAEDLPLTAMRGWTDDFSDILAPFFAKMRANTSNASKTD